MWFLPSSTSQSDCLMSAITLPSSPFIYRCLCSFIAASPEVNCRQSTCSHIVRWMFFLCEGWTRYEGRQTGKEKERSVLGENKERGIVEKRQTGVREGETGDRGEERGTVFDFVLFWSKGPKMNRWVMICMITMCK